MSWDESKHPRAPSGRADGGRFVDAARKGAGLPDQKTVEKDQAAKKMETFEDYIRNQSFESAAVYDLAGDLSFWKDGDEDSVEFDEDEFRWSFAHKMTHNHPSGRSFSENDVYMFETMGLVEVRACNSTGAFVMKRPLDLLRKTYFTKSSDELQWDYMFYNGRAKSIMFDLIKQGKAPAESDDLWTMHWAEYAKLRGYTFEFEVKP